MEQTQLLDWDDESVKSETLEDKDGSQEPVGRLHVFSNPYSPEKDFWIHCGENTIGRQATCHIPIPAPSISKRHAVIEAEAEGSHFIYDCGSLNRTRWRKSALKPHARYALEDGDLLLFADVACQYFILPHPSENGTHQADASGQGLMGSPGARETDSDDSLVVPGTQSCPAQQLVIEKTPAVGAVRKMGYGGVLAKDSDDDIEEGDRSSSRSRQEERASQDSNMSAESRHAPYSSAVFTPATSTVVPESDTEEGQEIPAGKDQLKSQPEQRRGAEQRPQDLFHLDSDTDVEDEDLSSGGRRTQRAARKGRPSTSQDMEGKGAEQPTVGIKKNRILAPDPDSDSDTEDGRTERSSAGLGDSSNDASTDQDSDTDVERERERKPGVGEGDSRQTNADQDSDTDMEVPSVGEGDSRQVNTDQDSDTNDGDVVARSFSGKGGIRQAIAFQERERLEEMGVMDGGRTEGIRRDSDTDVEGEEAERPSIVEEDIRHPCVQHSTVADVEEGLSITAADHSTPVERRSRRRPGPCAANAESEEETDTDGPSVAMLETQCYLDAASKAQEKERDSPIDTEEAATQAFISRPPTSELFKKPFVLMPSVGFLPTSGSTSLEKAEDWADDQLEIAETQPFCNNSIVSRSGAENTEVEPNQAFPLQGESEEVSQDETQPIALYLSFRAASEPQRCHPGTDTPYALQCRAASENQANDSTTQPKPLLTPEKGENPKISAQLSISEEETQVYSVETAQENMTEEAVHGKGETVKESREKASTLNDETQTYSVELEEGVQVGETLEVCRQEAKPQKQDSLENLTETNQVSKDNTQITVLQSSVATGMPLLTPSKVSNCPCTERSVDTLDGMDLEREQGEEKVSPVEVRTCENTGRDSGNAATQGEAPLPPVVKDAEKTGKADVKEDRRKGRKERKSLKKEEKPCKTTSEVLEEGKSSAVQLPEEVVSSIPGPMEEEKGGITQNEEVHKTGRLPCAEQAKLSQEQEQSPSTPGGHGNVVAQAEGKRRSVKQETPVKDLQPRSRSTRSARRKTCPIPEVNEEERETKPEVQPPPIPSQANKRMKKAVTDSTTNEPPAELEVPTLTRKTRSRRGIIGTEVVSKEVAVQPKRNRKSVTAEKDEVKGGEKEPQDLEGVREWSTLGTGEMKEKTSLGKHQVEAGIVDLPQDEREDKGSRTGATTASKNKYPAAEGHATIKSQETAGGRWTRKRGPTEPSQEEVTKPTLIDASTEQKRRRTRAAAVVAGVDGMAASNRRSQSKEAAAQSSSEESEVGLERAKRESASSKASQESLDTTQTAPRLTVSKEDLSSKRNRRSSSHGRSSGKQDQGPAASSQESIVAGQRRRKQSTASSEDKAEDATEVIPQERNTPRRICRTHGIGSPKANRDPTMPKVMFTGVIDEDGEQVVCKLGGELAESVYECTHLVTDRVRRTVKFLCALARGIPIVTLEWLAKCGKNGCFLCPSGFLVKDMEQECNFGFSLAESLQKARRGRLFEGYEIHVTPNVKPEPEHMKDIIQCSGATFLPKMPRTYKEKRVVISCRDDLPKCKPAFSAAIPVTNTEFMLTGILQQVVDLQAYALEAAVEAHESTGKRTSKRGATDNHTTKRRR